MPVMRRGCELDRDAERSRSDAGYTLIEIVVGLAVVAVALVGIYGLVLSAMRSFGLVEDALDAQQAGRLVAERLGEEVRWAEAVLPLAGCGATGLCPDRVALRIPAANPIRPGRPYGVEFRYDPRRQEVVRRQDGQEAVLASGVARLTFRYLTAQGGQPAHAREVARLQVEVTTASPDGRGVRRTTPADILLRNIGVAELPSPVPTEPLAGEPGRDLSWRPAPRPVTSLTADDRAQPSARAGGERPPGSGEDAPEDETASTEERPAPAPTHAPAGYPR